MPDTVVQVRSIDSIIQFHCVAEEIATSLSFLAAMPDMPYSANQIRKLKIESYADGFYDFAAPRNGGPGTLSHMRVRAHSLLREIMLEECENSPVMHAASVIAAGKRIVLLADKGSGKTTLGLKCLAAGFQVEGDEHVVVRQAEVVARPRTLRVKQGSLKEVPELAEEIVASPAICDWNGDLIYSFEPRTNRIKWKIAPGAVDFLVFLSPNHGGLTSMKRISKTAAFEKVISNTFLPVAGKVAALGRLHTLVAGAECSQMRVGCLNGAINGLRELTTTC